MEERLASDVLFGRPFWGVATFVKKSMINDVRCILEDQRCLVIKYGNLLFSNVYLPSYETNDAENRPGKQTLDRL